MPVSRLTVPAILGVNGEWCDVDYNPKIRMAMLATMLRPGRLFLYVVTEPCAAEAGLDLGRWGLYLRLGIDDGGRCAMVMQDGRNGPPFFPAIVVIYAEGGIREIACPVSAFGQNCVEVVGLGDGWFVWVQIDPVTVWRAKLSWDGTWSDEKRFTVPQTSQGFTDGARDGTIRMLDQWRSVYPGMVCPSEDTGLVVGQAGPPDRLVGLFGPVFFTVHRGNALEPHVVNIAENRWLACARDGGGPIVVALQAPFVPEQFEEPPAPPAPDPPTPVPDPEEPTVAIPDHFAVVKAISNENPELLAENSRESMTELLWRIGSSLHERVDERWGLLSKSEGEKHTIIEGVRVGVDALSYGDSNECVDIFGSTGDGPGTGSLTWDVKPRRESNKRVVPPPFAGGTVPVPSNPPPGPGPNPPTQPPPAADPAVPDLLRSILVALKPIAERVERLEASVNDKGNQVVGKIDELQRDVQGVNQTLQQRL